MKEREKTEKYIELRNSINEHFLLSISQYNSARIYSRRENVEQKTHEPVSMVMIHKRVVNGRAYPWAKHGSQVGIG